MYVQKKKSRSTNQPDQGLAEVKPQQKQFMTTIPLNSIHTLLASLNMCSMHWPEKSIQ